MVNGNFSAFASRHSRFPSNLRQHSLGVCLIIIENVCHTSPWIIAPEVLKRRILELLLVLLLLLIFSVPYLKSFVLGFLIIYINIAY